MSVFAYPTTIVPVHKTNVEGRLVFVFHFTDGLYYIEYNTLIFKDFDIKPIVYVRRGCPIRPINHYHIPVHLLSRIDI